MRRFLQVFSVLKQLHGNFSISQAVKIISQLIVHLPADQRFKVIFMRRDMREILASQQAMLADLAGPAAAGGNDEKMAAIFERHLSQTETWLTRQPNIDTLAINYNEILTAPERAVAEINTFLDTTAIPAVYAHDRPSRA